MGQSFAELWIRKMTKTDLDSLINHMKSGDSEAYSKAVNSNLAYVRRHGDWIFQRLESSQTLKIGL
jgi:hypothetical protein